MKRIIKLKHWQVFTVFMIFYVAIFIFHYNEFTIWNISSIKFEVFFSILLLILLFSWILTMGIFLNSIPDNPYHFKKWVIIFATISIVIGYTDLILHKLGNESSFIPLWYTLLTTPLTVWGIVYVFYKVPKSLKSIEVGRKVKFSECIIELILIAIFPIGVWIIQPRLNRIYIINEEIENEKTTNR
jgi:hypothetical protein